MGFALTTILFFASFVLFVTFIVFLCVKIKAKWIGLSSLICLVAAFLFLISASTSGISQEDYDIIVQQRDSLQEKYDLVVNERDSLKEENGQLKINLETLESEYKSLKGKSEAFFELTEDEQAAELARAEQERIEAEESARLAQEEADRAEAEKAAEEEAQRQAEEAARLEEEALGYETGISFKDISRNPDDYVGKKVKFTGNILQLIEDENLNEGRMSTNGIYDDVIYFEYDPSILEFRLLEDDEITVYGTFKEMYTYLSLSGDVTLPLISVDRIDLLS